MTIQPSISAIAHTSYASNYLVADVFKKLRKVEHEEELFQIGVEIVYQTLQCDRAVVYSLQSDSYCKVIAEAVTPGYAQILGKVIKDSCFENGYHEKYQKGRIRAIADIYKAELSTCHIGNLEKIQVKANLVAPLIDKDGSLIGLLVTHQCGQTRQWQQSEIELLLAIADWMMEQLSIEQQQHDLSSHVAQIEQHKIELSEIVREIHTAQKSQTVLDVATAKAKELLQCDRVVAYGLENSNMGKIIAESTLPSLAPILGRSIIDPCLEHSYRKKYQDGRVRAMNNIYEAGMTPCYIENLEKIGVKASIVVPINSDTGNIYGILVAHQCFQFREWRSAEINHFEEIAMHAGLCLSKTKLKERLQLINSNLSSIENTKKQLHNIRQSIQQVQKPIEDTSRNFVEINNLSKLLDREFKSIEQNSSLQTRKDIKLIQIFVKKLLLNIVKLRQSLKDFEERKDTLDSVIKKIIIGSSNKK